LYAPAAVLAARELARWLARWSDPALVKRSVGALLAVFALYSVYLHTVFARTDEVRDSEGVEALGRKLKAESSRTELDSMLHVDSPFALQFHLNTMHRAVSFEAAATAFAQDQPTLVAVADLERLQEVMGERSKLIIAARWPEAGAPRVVIVAGQASAAGASSPVSPRGSP
jgi:hypothetical protein